MEKVNDDFEKQEFVHLQILQASNLLLPKCF